MTTLSRPTNMNNQTNLVLLLVGFALTTSAHAASFIETESFATPGNAEQMIYSPTYNSLILRNAGSAVKVIDLATKQSQTHLANVLINDIDMTTSGRYVYAADYGGENIGYGTPASQHYVHRLDLQSKTWDVKTTDQIAGHIEAISDNRFVLSALDQWVDFSLNTWGSGSSTQTDNVSSFITYRGDIEYDSSTGRIIHGNSGSSSNEISAFKINGNSVIAQETSGTYGSAQGYGGTSVLSTDNSSYYYGALQVEALDVSHNTLVFPEYIYAATGQYAFGASHYYDATTGELLGSLRFTSNVYALNPNGDDFWAFDSASNTLRHFAPVPLPASFLLFGSAFGALALFNRRKLAFTA